MTIREIARLCGVSRGTVDRVLNGRGKVRPETEARILATLSQVGYTKNIAARALTVRKAAPVIGVILSSEGNPFFDEVLAGIRQAEASLADYGVTVRLQTMRGYDPQAQLALIDALAADIAVLVIQPIDDARIAARIAALADAGIPTVTVNSDLRHSARACYVGSDYARGGETAAGIVRVVTGGAGSLGLITGVDSILGHRQRQQAFEARLAQSCPKLRIAARASGRDDDAHACEVTGDMLRRHPDITALVVMTAGLAGVRRAIVAAGRAAQIAVIAFDHVPITEEMMREGLLRAVVCQQPYQQGWQSVCAAYDILLTGRPGQTRYIMENQIKILENLSD